MSVAAAAGAGSIRRRLGFLSLAVLVLHVAIGVPAHAEFRRVIRVDPAKFDLARRPAPPNRPGMLVDGELTWGRGRVREAYLINPTGRYRHGILGDSVEAGGFQVVTADGQAFRHLLGPESVFEDLRVRLWDVDGDGADEAVLVRSYLDSGAALAVYRIGAKGIERLAETAPLGIPNRWLNPVGAADFDGDGRIEIALVTTPHIGGTLTLYRLEAGGLVRVYDRYGFSNHRIGSRELDLSAVIDFDGDGTPDIVLPDSSRSGLRVVTFARGRFKVLAQTRHDSAIETRVVVRNVDGDGKTDLVYGLDDGTARAALR